MGCSWQALLVFSYKDMKLWRFIVLIKYTRLRADTTWYKHVRVYTIVSLQGMLSSDNNHCVLQCCTATLLIDIHVKPVFITAQLQFINILGTGWTAACDGASHIQCFVSHITVSSSVGVTFDLIQRNWAKHEWLIFFICPSLTLNFVL